VTTAGTQGRLHRMQRRFGKDSHHDTTAGGGR
jgi:hypothetical protein